jgi:hypothetical protein
MRLLAKTALVTCLNLTQVLNDGRSDNSLIKAAVQLNVFTKTHIRQALAAGSTGPDIRLAKTTLATAGTSVTDAAKASDAAIANGRMLHPLTKACEHLTTAALVAASSSTRTSPFGAGRQATNGLSQFLFAEKGEESKFLLHSGTRVLGFYLLYFLRPRNRWRYRLRNLNVLNDNSLLVILNLYV